MTKEYLCGAFRGTAAVLLLVMLSISVGQAVTSKVTRQTTSKDLAAGQSEGVVISSRGTIQLGRAAKVLASEFENVWSVNSIVVSGGTIFLGTSPNGHVFKYSLGKLTKIFPPEEETAAAQPEPTAAKPAEPQAGEPKKDGKEAAKDAGKSEKKDEGKIVEATERLSNQHIFAMSLDVAGRLLAGISGDKCRLCRYEAGKMETIFEPNDAKYIFDIETDNVGNIYLATGPQGRVYVLDPSGKVAQLVYRGRDKNILSIAASRDGFLYAGTDTRGLVYKINPRNKTATVLYDSDEPEITALFAQDGTASPSGVLYATATSASRGGNGTEVRRAAGVFRAARKPQGRRRQDARRGRHEAEDCQHRPRLRSQAVPNPAACAQTRQAGLGQLRLQDQQAGVRQ